MKSTFNAFGELSNWRGVRTWKAGFMSNFLKGKLRLATSESSAVMTSEHWNNSQVSGVILFSKEVSITWDK